MTEWVSSFLTARQHILGHSLPYDGVENIIKEWRYNQGYLATTNKTIKLHLCHLLAFIAEYTQKWNFKKCTLCQTNIHNIGAISSNAALNSAFTVLIKPLPIYNFHIHTNNLESIQRVQTSAKDYGISCNVKLVHTTEIRLIAKVDGITLLTSNILQSQDCIHLLDLLTLTLHHH